MLFSFQLKPLELIAPWGAPSHPSLSWFGLTDGEFWIEAGESTLLEYGEQARQDGARHCTYQVAQLHEDLMDMLPYILEPVPVALTPYLFGDEANAWWDAYESWYDRNLAALSDDTALQQLDHDAHRLMYGRVLDTSYLADRTHIAIWSDEENVYFGWDNREPQGQPVWSAAFGEFQMPRREFLAELQSFHARLIEQMANRVEQVRSGMLPPGIQVDLDELVMEQDSRDGELHDALSLKSETDWAAVQRAIQEILEAKQLA